MTYKMVKTFIIRVSERPILSDFDNTNQKDTQAIVYPYIPRFGCETEHLHNDVRFAMQATDSTQYVVSEESHDLAWVAIDNLQAFTQEESILRMARNRLDRVSHSSPSRWS